MPRYHIFGGTLAAPLAIPELHPASDAAEPTWTLAVERDAEPPRDQAVQVAEDDIGGGARARLFHLPTGVRVEHSDTGAFDVRADGTCITWYPAPDAPEHLARLDLIGRVLAVALQRMGALCLHASAVAVGERAIAFLAPKGYGKSTTAVALTYAGARLITDDTLAVLPGPPPTCVPGVQSVRLRPDAARRFDRTRDATVPEGIDSRVLDAPPEELVQSGGAPLAALYILAPAQPDAEEPVVRRALPPVAAAMSMVMHGKLGALQGPDEAAANLRLATRLTADVPAYSLEIARDLHRVSEVAERILAWHRD